MTSYCWGLTHLGASHLSPGATWLSTMYFMQPCSRLTQACSPGKGRGAGIMGTPKCFHTSAYSHMCPHPVGQSQSLLFSKRNNTGKSVGTGRGGESGPFMPFIYHSSHADRCPPPPSSLCSSCVRALPRGHRQQLPRGGRPH